MFEKFASLAFATHHAKLRLFILFNVLLGLLVLLPIGIWCRCFLWFLYGIVLPGLVVFRVNSVGVSQNGLASTWSSGAVMGGSLSFASMTVANLAGFVNYLFLEGKPYSSKATVEEILLLIWAEIWLALAVSVLGSIVGGTVAIFASRHRR